MMCLLGVSQNTRFVIGQNLYRDHAFFNTINHFRRAYSERHTRNADRSFVISPDLYVSEAKSRLQLLFSTRTLSMFPLECLLAIALQYNYTQSRRLFWKRLQT
jgi:hypothetical protein